MVPQTFMYEYRDSGLEWLGEIPVHWEMLKGAWLGKLFGSESVPDDHVVNSGSLAFIKVSSLSLESFDLAEKNFFVSDARYKSVKTRKDFVVFPKRGAAIFTNKVNIVREDAVIDPNLMGWEVNERVFPEYIAHLLKLRGLEDIADVSTVPQINNKHISPMRLPVPPRAEQHTIVAFLDYETGKIDRLIEKQEQLIALLKEKRQAVISHAVTKGLNPAVPMRHSGIEWLGEVPAHWEVTKIYHRYEVQLGKMLNHSRITGNNLFPYLRVFDVQWGKINIQDLPQMDFDKREREKFRLQPGDLLVNEGGSYVGRSALWKGDLANCFYQKALHRMRPRSTEDTSRYLYHVMRGPVQRACHAGGKIYSGTKSPSTESHSKQRKNYFS